jgi:hypothetical protein
MLSPNTEPGIEGHWTASSVTACFRGEARVYSLAYFEISGAKNMGIGTREFAIDERVLTLSDGPPRWAATMDSTAARVWSSESLKPGQGGSSRTPCTRNARGLAIGLSDA